MNGGGAGTRNAFGLRASVVIRNRNERDNLAHVLLALSRQSYEHDVIVVDNASTDGSVETAASYGTRIVPIERFTYGAALNLGCDAAAGDVIILLSAHAVPLTPTFVEECVRTFARDREVAAVRCVMAGKHSDEVRWLAPERIVRPNVLDIVSKGPLASGCAIGRRFWEEVPFDEEAAAAEEKLWALDVVRRGGSIVSPVPAPYAYIARRSFEQDLRKSELERRVILERTGVDLGRDVTLAKSASALAGAIATQTKARYLEWALTRERRRLRERRTHLDA